MTGLADVPKRPLSQLEPGALFAGYRIERVLDRGGMGVVYKAVDEDLEREVALKIIAPEHTQDDTAVARFKAECRLAASLEHANIVPIHRGGEFEGILYLAMRFVPGTNLRAIIDRGPMELDQVASIVTQVAGALDAAHAKGLVHRDVKPANILIAGEPGKPHVYLTDFGLTKRLGSADEALTREGGWVGTPDYVAPEQIQGHTVDRRADVYSLGCVLFEMLTGRVAYEKDSDMAKLWAHVTDPPPLPRTIRPELIGAFDDIIARGTAKEPGHRYATAGDLADGDAGCDRPAAERAQPQPLGRRRADPGRRRRAGGHALWRGSPTPARRSSRRLPPRRRPARLRRRPPAPLRPRRGAPPQKPAPQQRPEPRQPPPGRPPSARPGRRASRAGPAATAATTLTAAAEATGCAGAPSRWPGCSCCCSAWSSR